MRPGVRLGVDVGSVRIGIAVSDPSGFLATPVETVPRDIRDHADIRRIAELAREHGVVEVVVGLPLSLSGARHAAAKLATEFATELAAAVAPLGVRMVDERMSTVSAHGQLQAAGQRSKARRGVVDQAAAVIILQTALDAERVSGRPPGEIASAGKDGGQLR
jgi:putative Holliday junction resolvase